MHTPNSPKTPPPRPKYKITAATPLEAARELVRQGCTAKLAFELAADHFDTSPDSVRGLWNRSGAHPDKRHGNAHLTDQQDTTLLLLVLGFSAANRPLDIPLLRHAMLSLFDVKVGKRWCQRWIEKHADDLTLRKSKYLAGRRCDSTVLESVHAFIAAVEAHQQLMPYGAQHVVNYDETRYAASTDGGLVIEAKGKDRANSAGQAYTTVASVLTFICADGTVVCSFWIFGAKFRDENESSIQSVLLDSNRYPRRKDWTRFIAFTDTGYVNSELFAGCVNKFINEWKGQRGDTPCWVFGDQLGCHIQLPVIKQALDQGIELWFLPANTSHFLQPLDHVPFAHFKRSLSSKMRATSMASTFSHTPPIDSLIALGYQTERECFTAAVICKGFAGTGIFPWNPELILKNAEANAGNIQNSDNPAQQTATAALAKLVDAYANSSSALNATVKKRKVRAKKNQIFGPADFVAAAEAMSVAATQAKAEATAARISNTCRFPGCDVVRRCGKLWFVCDSCDVVFCPKHKKEGRLHECDE
jgi:hypothetical protein